MAVWVTLPRSVRRCQTRELDSVLVLWRTVVVTPSRSGFRNLARPRGHGRCGGPRVQDPPAAL